MRSQEEITGRLIAFEGIDRAGKSSVIKMVRDRLDDSKTPIRLCGEKESPLVRLLGSDELRKMSMLMKTYLFATDRAWTYEKTCLPALRQGEVVLWDRYVDSALVYRTVEMTQKASEIDLEFVEKINEPFLRPHLTILIDISPEISSERAAKDAASEPYDREFLAAVRKEYLKRAELENYQIVNGKQPIEMVADEVSSRIRNQFKEMF
jgi:dTMP kinase